MLAPAYTAMRDDVGRLTQKWPGVAENGSVYNHASAFYIYALYQIKQSDRAFKILRQMIPNTESTDLIQRGQLPVEHSGSLTVPLAVPANSLIRVQYTGFIAV